MKKALGLILCALLLIGGTCLASSKVFTEQAIGFQNGIEHTGVYNTGGVPMFNGVKWKFKTDGPIYASPTIVDGVAFVGSEDTYLYAINVEEGTEEWRFKTNGPIKSTATVFEDTVFVSSRDGYLYAIKAKNGKLRWKYKAECEDKRKDNWDYWQASPIIYEDLVFFGGWDEKMYALRIDTGELVQTYSVGRTHSTPTIVNDKLYVGTMAEGVSTYDVKTGEKLWASENFVVYSSIVYDNGLIFAGARSEGSIKAFDAETGELKWEFVSPGKTWLRIHATPAIANGIMYVGSSEALSLNTASVYAVDASNGRSLWETKVINSVQGSPAYTSGILYVVTSDIIGLMDTGMIVALDAHTGAELWSYETYGLINSSPVIDQSVLYVGSNDGYLYAIH